MSRPEERESRPVRGGLESHKLQRKPISQRARLKREVFCHLYAWLETGNENSLRLALSKGDALATGSHAGKRPR